MSTFYGLSSSEETSFNLINKIENQADYVIRFAYCLTLNMVDSEVLCQEVFKEAVQKGVAFWDKETRVLRNALFEIVWQKYNSQNSKSDVDEIKPNDLKISKVIKSMDLINRTVLVLIDALGVDPAFSFKLLGVSEQEGRQKLSDSRQQLVNFKF